MLTPVDIQNKRFDKAMSGYRPEDVSAFLEEVAEYVAQLQEENEDLERKLEILAETLEQYREDEDSLRQALIVAQKTGDSVVRDAKQKAEAIIAKATQKAEDIISGAQSSIDQEALELSRLQMDTARFKSHLLTLYKSQIESIQKIPGNESAAPREEEPDAKASGAEDEARYAVVEEAAVPVKKVQAARERGNGSRPAEDIDDEAGYYPEERLAFKAVDKIGDEDPDDEAVDNTDAFPKRKPPSRFGKLRFGEDFELKRNE